MKKERRWLKSAIAASLEAPVSLPWNRGARRKPEAIRGTAPKPRIAAAAR
jgi:hypothetical protein